MQEACSELATYADSVGAHFAVETGPETSATLKAFLDTLGSKGVAVNLDPANLAMVTGDDAVEAVYNLKDYIVHTHAKDGVMLKKKVEQALSIGAEAAEHEALLKMGHSYLELPLGEGDVDFDIYLPALKATGFDGFLTIEREVGDNPEKDIAMAVDFLKAKVATL
jgi:sugar phosphate isomerase/epimerase